ncbi:glycosyltransferase family 9 protein [Thermocrinis minervae]|uniref:ADP-heptose:LPS heptosyltransferase n=1 Tax=Thermocrinis minervae TaxID=381751 RepID=A0A1M6S7W0_9AQUI|nr:glycosyltransferase family 9 protein [Thermocrinis minervae]SHK40761.1 ADP-heptose:LPS heptosyltransferase [Thermocrinis minervae]
MDPKATLFLMGHSAGVGDVLRVTAALKAFKMAYPESEIHLVLLTKDKGYVSEELMSKHCLLNSFHSIDKRIRSLKDWKRFFNDFEVVVEKVRPDLIVDLEPHGLKSSFLCMYARLKYGIKTVGIAEFPLRGLFYTVRAEPTRKVLKSVDYTDRFFVALKPLGIERKGTPIELCETPEGKAFRESFRRLYNIPNKPLLGLNIGCGTPDALWRRPSLKLLRQVVRTLQSKMDAYLVLTGASFEKDINQAFLQDYDLPALDMAGKTSISELTGLIKSFSLFISTDSGPYHMAVALRVPTLAIFVKDFPQSYHHHPWVRCVVLDSEEKIDKAVRAGLELLLPLSFQEASL